MSAIIVLDVRNFSSHCEYLTINHIHLLKTLISDLLNESVGIIDKIKENEKDVFDAYFNHTGDGFLLIIDSTKESYYAVLFAQRLRKFINHKILEYSKALDNLLPENKLPPLSYGIGIHKGAVDRYPYVYYIQNAKYSNFGFIGNDINVASRIEQSTKDHNRKVICSSDIFNGFRKSYKLSSRHIIKIKYFEKLGLHSFKGIKVKTCLYGIKPELFKQ